MNSQRNKNSYVFLFILSFLIRHYNSTSHTQKSLFQISLFFSESKIFAVAVAQGQQQQQHWRSGAAVQQWRQQQQSGQWHTGAAAVAAAAAAAAAALAQQAVAQRQRRRGGSIGALV